LSLSTECLARRSLLHPVCQTLTERDGTVLELPRDAFLDDLPIHAGREASSCLLPRRFDRIVSIDKSGADTAAIKLVVGGNSVAGDRLLLDYLMLVAVGGGWRVVSRVYTSVDV
jgi:hypothetical protein